MFGKLVLLFAIFVAIAVARPQYYPNYGYNGYGASYPGYYGYSGYSSPVGYTGYGSYSSPYNYGYGYY